LLLFSISVHFCELTKHAFRRLDDLGAGPDPTAAAGAATAAGTGAETGDVEEAGTGAAAVGEGGAVGIAATADGETAGGAAGKGRTTAAKCAYLFARCFCVGLNSHWCLHLPVCHGVFHSEDVQKRKELKELEELTKDQRTVFVSQLVMKTAEQDLRDYFGQLGEVRSIVMIRDKNTGRHKGGGYVEMADLETIPLVLQLNGTCPPWQPRFPIMVKASEAEKNFIARKEAATGGQPQQPQQPAAARGPVRNNENRVYVGNLHFNITEQDLQEVLKACGEVCSRCAFDIFRKVRA
jgi:hypothetical protein